MNMIVDLVPGTICSKLMQKPPVARWFLMDWILEMQSSKTADYFL